MKSNFKTKNANILGVRVDILSYTEVENLVKDALAKKSPPLFIATVNPSFIIKAQKDLAFREILNKKTTLNVIDGVGVKMAVAYLEKCVGLNLPKKVCLGLSVGFGVGIKGDFTEYTLIKGVHLLEKILSLAQRTQKKVLVVHKRTSITSAEEIEIYLSKTYPQLNFEVSLGNVTLCDVLICDYGEVLQEGFIADNMGKTSALVSIGVGGSFDILCGNVHIPHNFRYPGLDWLYRIFSNPKRAKKAFISAVIFPFRVFIYSL